MQLSPQRFNAAARGPSQSVLWRPAHLCPCRDPFSGAARLGCLQCGGKGVLWDPPKPAWTVVAGMRMAREWAQFGMWESGDVVLTIPSDSPLYGAGANDRVLFVNSTEPFSVTFTRSGSELLAGAIVSVDRVFWLDAAQRIVTGAAPTQNPDGTLAWASTNGEPPAGTQYSISGRRNQEYFLFKDLPQDRAHFGGAALPRRVALRRWDLFGR